jgi:hypothetical protein
MFLVRSVSTRWLPTNPAAPVTNTRCMDGMACESP